MMTLTHQFSRIRIVLFATLLIFSMNTSAQDSAIAPAGYRPPQLFIYKGDTLSFEKPNLWRNIKSVPRDMLQIGKYPFQGKHWINISAIALSSAILIHYDQALTDGVKHASAQIHLDPETNYREVWKPFNLRILKIPLNWNSALYQMGEGGTSIMLAGGLFIYGKISKDYRAVSTAYDISETFITMGLTTQIMKRISGRESPFVATRPGGAWRPFPSFSDYQHNTPKYDGFPSGHLATLMATITVLSYNYPEKKWIKPVGYTLIGMAGWAMMNTEVHWIGDYPLALAVGYLSGKITTMKHRKPKKLYRSLL